LKVILLNLALGVVPLLIYGASLAAGIEDDTKHRRVFLLVYGLWAFTLAGWNWIEGSHFAFSLFWLLSGLTLMVLSMRRQKAKGQRQK
jgi:hypothetical protein